MTLIEANIACPVHESFRVAQVSGMFDVPLAERMTERFQAEAPEGDWRIGLIVGPSGSGKTTIARQLFGECIDRGHDWVQDRAVIDAFGPMPIRRLVGLLTVVGFSSPPSWVKPYHVLSTGERFRCDLARALADAESQATDAPAVMDEFTSTVDRPVAKACAAALGKAIRQGRIGCRFVGVTCHDDIAAWLQPDWILDMADGRCRRRRLRRPAIRLEVVRARRTAWRMFARHHYLSCGLSTFAECFLAIWNDQPVAFCALLAMAGKPGRRRISRLVTLPDYQGLGIGTALMEAVAELQRAAGRRVNITASHPALLAHCRRSPRWRSVGVKPTGSRHQGKLAGSPAASLGRAVAAFEYMGRPVHRTA